MLAINDAREVVVDLLRQRDAEGERLRRIQDYYKGLQTLAGVPTGGVPTEVRNLAEMARVNVMRLVVGSLAQSLYVDGFRGTTEAENAEVWQAWQANKLDRRQIGLHRATLTYGVGYSLVLPGDNGPAISLRSPLKMTTVYGENLYNPIFALEDLRNGLVRLIDDTSVYYFDSNHGTPTFIEVREHGQEVTPVVRFVNVDDVDDEVYSEVEDLIPLQNQIDATTFDLLVAQHYGAFRQRYIMGWVADDETQKLHAAASRLWTFDDDVKVGEFEQTDLSGFLESREASLRHMATVSQTPVHELLGQLVNLSAEALVAARDSQDRKLDEKETTFGEGWEQTLELAGRIGGFEVPADAEVRWRDSKARSLSATADALGKLATQLGVPKRELWSKIPGVSQQDIERWTAVAAAEDSTARLADILDRQSAGADLG